MELLPSIGGDASWQTSLEISRSSADRLLRTMDDFRDLLSDTTPAGGAIDEFDLTLCLGETIELLSLASREPAGRIVLEGPAEAVLIRQDRQYVEEVATRILDTALKLTPGGVRLSTSVATIANGARFSIMPGDSGLAVRLVDWLNADPERVNYRDLPDMPYPVTVMVAGKRMRALGGSAQIACESGAPTRLTIYLPSQPCQHCEGHEQEVQPNSLNILLTEDCDDSYALTALVLRNENVWRARNGAEAIHLVKQQRFDVLLMDVHLPGMDGYTVIHTIRDWETETGNARTPIVVLSSDDLEKQRRFAARAGCSGFLRKPVRNNDLLDLLDRLKSARLLTV
jgi:CheY-like chemotaxis protein